MKELGTEIETQASVERVWGLITDFAGFSLWNPFIRWVRGDAKVGARLEVRIQPSGAQRYDVQAHATQARTQA